MCGVVPQGWILPKLCRLFLLLLILLKGMRGGFVLRFSAEELFSMLLWLKE